MEIREIKVHQMAILEQVIKIRQQLPGLGTGKLHHLLTNFLVDHKSHSACSKGVNAFILDSRGIGYNIIVFSLAGLW